MACGQKLVAQIERVKKNIIAEVHETLKAHEQLINRAVGEAEALAWQTAYPQLVFPVLAVEKVQSVAAWHSRQQSLYRRLAAFAQAN